MLQVNLNSAVIRRLFQARRSTSAQPAPTERQRRAADSTADSKDAIGTASPEDPLPVFLELEDWDRHRRWNFNWDELLYLADYRTDVSFADLTRVSAAKSTLVRLYQDWYQVTTLFSVDRTFLETSTVAWLVSFLEIRLVGGLSEFEDIEDAIKDAHFSSHAHEYGEKADNKEPPLASVTDLNE